MKRNVSILIALALVLSMVTTVFAADIIPTGDTTHAVTALYQAGSGGGTVYGVDISWGSMVFTYTDASKDTWNAETHMYSNTTEAAWSCEEGENVITVTNHSNVPISVTPSYTAESDYNAATMSFDKTILTLGTADNGVDGAAGTATNGTIIVTASGTLTKDEKTTSADGTTIGQITLTLADASLSGN